MINFPKIFSPQLSPKSYNLGFYLHELDKYPTLSSVVHSQSLYWSFISYKLMFCVWELFHIHWKNYKFNVSTFVIFLFEWLNFFFFAIKYLNFKKVYQYRVFDRFNVDWVFSQIKQDPLLSQSLTMSFSTCVALFKG